MSRQEQDKWMRPLSQRKETRFNFENICYVMNEFSPKVRYGQWLHSLGLKEGDYVVNKAAVKPLCQGSYIRVMGLQEIQFLCTYDIDGRPKAINLWSRGDTNKNGWWAVPDDWEKVDPPKDEWKFELP
jgi:hypothetical protein